MGFPSPATDYVEMPLSLDALCCIRSPSVYLMRYEAGSVVERIRPGALLVIDSALTPDSGSLVVVERSGEFVVRRYVAAGGVVRLENLDNPERGSIVSEADMTNAEGSSGETTICFGVVSHVLASL